MEVGKRAEKVTGGLNDIMKENERIIFEDFGSTANSHKFCLHFSVSVVADDFHFTSFKLQDNNNTLLIVYIK